MPPVLIGGVENTQKIREPNVSQLPTHNPTQLTYRLMLMEQDFSYHKEKADLKGKKTKRKNTNIQKGSILTLWEGFDKKKKKKVGVPTLWQSGKYQITGYRNST
jgi:hypothetical protein